MKQPLSVLVIDDHESVRAGIKAALSRAGHVCVGEAVLPLNTHSSRLYPLARKEFPA